MSIQSERSSLEILYSISRELAASLDLHTVLERVLSLSTSNIGAERASLVVLDEKGNPIDAAIISNGELTPTTIEQMQDVITSGLAGWVIRNKKSALLNNTANDERWLFRPNSNSNITSGKSALCIPVMVHEKLVGVLTIVHTQIDFFTEEHVALQKAITEIAGVAIRNAELYKDVQNAHLRYYDLFEENIDPILITDLHGKILEANQEASRETGDEISALQQLTIADLHPLAAEKIGVNFENIPERGSIIYESSLKKNGHEILPVEVHVSQIIIADGTYLQWIFRDIQEQKKIEQLRDDLSAMLYHDLRSPLANIISSLDIMGTLLPDSPSESLKSVFNVAKRSTERMQRMIDGLLDINRLESGQQITNKQLTDFKTLVNGAIEVVQSAAKNKEITIRQQIDPDVPAVSVDAEMIRRVIINLLENDIKFSPDQSTIQIGSKKDQGFIVFWVDDRGNGIPDKFKEEIFEKFIRLKQNYPVKGLGLGLAFCKLAVQAHGGTIWVENIPQGGSRFVFSLPLSH
jgi:PAS domain S-box-containing protein